MFSGPTLLKFCSHLTALCSLKSYIVQNNKMTKAAPLHKLFGLYITAEINNLSSTFDCSKSDRINVNSHIHLLSFFVRRGIRLWTVLDARYAASVCGARPAPDHGGTGNTHLNSSVTLLARMESDSESASRLYSEPLPGPRAEPSGRWATAVPKGTDTYILPKRFSYKNTADVTGGAPIAV
jgi:hypothetical protein